MVFVTRRVEELIPKSIKFVGVFIVLLGNQVQAATTKEVVYTISVTIPAVIGVNKTNKNLNGLKEGPTPISSADIQTEEARRDNQLIILKTITAK